MNESIYRIIFQFIGEIIFLPYYYFPNLVTLYYGCRKYRGVKKVLIYLFLPIIVLFAPFGNIFLNLALYGTLLDTGANKAILAAPRGFTNGVYDFVKDKPIELWDVNDLTKKSYTFDNYIDYQLANAKSLNDVKKYIQNKTGYRIK